MNKAGGHKPAASGALTRQQLLSRVNLARMIVILIVLVLVGRTAWVQLVWGPKFKELAANQRSSTVIDPAIRGAITDTHGNLLAYTMQARTLSTSPAVLRRDLDLRHSWNEEKNPAAAQAIEQIADDLMTAFGESHKLNRDDLITALNSDETYVVLARYVDPDLAAQITDKWPDISAERADIRQYPNGAIGENVVGKTSLDGSGQFGLEVAADAQLAGINGRYTRDISAQGQVIPGTERDRVAPMDGATISLTLDEDLQAYVQQQLEQAKQNSGAKSAGAVVLDAHSAQVLAMASTGTIDPNGDIARQLEKGKSFGNPPISDPFEPGSVAKIITAATVIEDGLSNPDEVLAVPGQISMAGVTVKDAWSHGTVNFTTTGVFGKSSNVGTLMLASRIGEDRFAEMLDKFGIGQETGIELPSESAGIYPSRSQWSGGTFANLPIGQGMSVSLLQMAGIYQTIANDGVRVQPRIIKSIVAANGKIMQQPAPATQQVVSAQTAQTVRTMFQAVTQADPTGLQQGTGPGAAVTGYQISGKTGTAQQVDPGCNCYSNSKYWITFAGIAPADNPRFVVALMLDNPQRGVHGEAGQSAAPLFHDIAAWLLNRDNIPTSPEAPRLVLQP